MGGKIIAINLMCLFIFVWRIDFSQIKQIEWDENIQSIELVVNLCKWTVRAKEVNRPLRTE